MSNVRINVSDDGVVEVVSDAHKTRTWQTAHNNAAQGSQIACFVLDVNPLMLRCGGDSVIFGMDYFLGSFIRIVEEDDWLRDQRRRAR